MKIYKLMTGVNVVLVIVLSMIVYDVARNDITDLGLMFDICFTLALGIHICTFMLSISQMSKLVSAETRGSMLALNGVAGSLCILIIQACGGYLYDEVSRNWPFIIGLGCYSFLTLVTLLLTALGKLKI